MAVKVQKSVLWRAGEGTPVKYEFIVDAETDITKRTRDSITLYLRGKITIHNHDTHVFNSWAASDFAVLTTGDKDPGDHQFSPGTSYHLKGLPFLPNAPRDYLDAMVAEFRGDIFTGGKPNQSTLWTKDKGVVVDAVNTDATRVIDIDTTYTVHLNGQTDQPVLIWQDSGANNATDYHWLQRKVWVSLVDFDYRPGMEYDCKSGTWQSVNKHTGEAKEFTGRVCSTLSDIRAIAPGAPATRTDNKGAYYWDCNSERWSNQYKVGLNS